MAVGRIPNAWKLNGIPLVLFTVQCHCGNVLTSSDETMRWKGVRCEPCAVVYHVYAQELLPCGCERPWDHLSSVCYTWLAAHPKESKTDPVPHHCFACQGRGEIRQTFNMPTKDDPLGPAAPPRIECTPCRACDSTGIDLSGEPGEW